jgi:hypothetical protein
MNHTDFSLTLLPSLIDTEVLDPAHLGHHITLLLRQSSASSPKLLLDKTADLNNAQSFQNTHVFLPLAYSYSAYFLFASVTPPTDLASHKYESQSSREADIQHRRNLLHLYNRVSRKGNQDLETSLLQLEIKWFLAKVCDDSSGVCL